MKRRLKLPNGFGSIVQLSGNRRKPYAVRKHGKYLAYFSYYEDAMIFLADYNKQPTIYSTEQTFAEIYKLEITERKSKIGPKTVKGYESAFQHCRTLWSMKLTAIRVTDLQGVIADVSAKGVGQPTQKKVRQIFHNVYRYAVKYQLIASTADISGYIDIDNLKRKYKKTPFNTRQLNRVKAIADDSSHELSSWAKCVVMMCYCGTRPSEFLEILKVDVKMKSRCFLVRNSKTAAGRNRLVPISRKALPYYDYWLSCEGRTLITDNGKPVSYTKFLNRFKKVMAAARCNHRPHECRHTCATWLDDKGANKLSIKRILGHATTDITDGVYTHKDLRQLKKAIDLL